MWLPVQQENILISFPSCINPAYQQSVWAQKSDGRSKKWRPKWDSTEHTYSDGKQAVAPDAEVEEQILVDVVKQRLVDFGHRLHQQLYCHQYVYVHLWPVHLKWR